MKHLLRILLLTLSPGLVPVPTLAQDMPAGDPATGDAELRYYAVEVIIFRYDELDSVGTEVFVPELLEEQTEIPTFGDVAGGDPAAASAGTPARTLEIPPATVRYRLLEADELTMRETAARLRRLQAYEPLMHFGWVQVAIPEADAPPLALDRFGTPPAGLEGTLTLRLSRYLHLGVDLSLPANEPFAPARQSVPDDDSASTPDSMGYRDGATRYAPLRYELEETRIIRTGETRYYDHPYFGVIARVTRADELPETATP